jgi:hypothetical protein
MTLDRPTCILAREADLPPEEEVMRRGVVVWMGCVVMLAVAGAASARNEHDLSADELQGEMAHNRALAAYVARNGEPDVAETHFLADTPPWDDHEVTLYYLDTRKEIGFARAWILGSPEIQMQRYERPLTDAQVAMLTTRAHARTAAAPAGAGGAGGPDERAENAAHRAEAAADKLDAAADTAERAAAHAEAVASQSVAEFHKSLRK